MTDSRSIERARELREESSRPEVILWSDLRDRRLAGLKFRRQQPLGPYIADFYCAEARLVIELDGSLHHARGAYDALRDQWMREQGVETLRAPVSMFVKHWPVVLRSILRVAKQRLELLQPQATPHPAASPPPSPARGEGAESAL